jgi:hypothetical protein
MNQGNIAVLAGWVALASRWAKFSEDWDRVLRMSPRIRYFKWKEARGLDGEFNGMSEPMRDEKTNLLASVIAEHEPLGIASVILNDLHNQIFGLNPDKNMRNPYFLSFYSIVIQLVYFLAKRGSGPKVDFIFDIQPGQMESATASWERLREVSPENAKAIIGNVSFHDDVNVVPLQAADMSAGWIREQSERFYSNELEQTPPWGNRANHIPCLMRVWTRELYEELARETALFEIRSSAKLDGR